MESLATNVPCPQKDVFTVVNDHLSCIRDIVEGTEGVWERILIMVRNGNWRWDMAGTYVVTPPDCAGVNASNPPTISRAGTVRSSARHTS